jgi:signal transduction histidine kinase
MIYAAAPVFEDEKVLGVVQLSRPVTDAAAAVRRRWWALAGGVSVLSLLAVVASSWIAASLARPLEQLRVSTLRLAAGDLDTRLPDLGSDEIGQVAAAFNDMADKVQAMLEEQRAFASNASHELRTPLTTIRLRSEALRAGTLDPATARQYSAEIDDEVARLGGLVEDLILLSRLDAGRAARGQESVDVVRLAQAALRDLSSLAQTQGVALLLDTPAARPTVWAASNHLRVVLRNLLSNALTYTPAGGSVTCRLRVEGDHLVLVVADTGQGVAPEDLPHLFERFYRADKAHGRAIRGAGLGLALVRSIVETYGGAVTLTSSGLGQGTTVQVIWPLGRESSADTPGHPIMPDAGVRAAADPAASSW